MLILVDSSSLTLPSCYSTTVAVDCRPTDSINFDLECWTILEMETALEVVAGRSIPRSNSDFVVPMGVVVVVGSWVNLAKSQD
ncbi:hypothetical protein U1Q18_042290 [Sarracenia purpurea var. burkii]